MKYLDLFAGYGGFSLGIYQAYLKSLGEYEIECASTGYMVVPDIDKPKEPECVGFSEIDKYAVEIYKKHFPKNKNYGDITKINPKELPDFELLCGGFPCQAFSIAGKRLGFSDTRGTLFFDVVRIIKEKKPKYLLLENVKGLLSHDNGRTFKTILSTLVELGYSVEWSVINAKYFGVPQNRERVFIVGHLGGFGGRQVFPIRATTIENKNKVCPTIRATYYKNGDNNALVAIPLKFLQRNQKNLQGEYSFTIDTVNSGGIMKDYRIRRFTPKECERLMGLPDGWTEGVSDTQRYKLCGNGVVVNVVEEIIKRLL